MTGFEPWIPDVGSDHSINSSTTTTHEHQLRVGKVLMICNAQYLGKQHRGLFPSIVVQDVLGLSHSRVPS